MMAEGFDVPFGADEEAAGASGGAHAAELDARRRADRDLEIARASKHWPRAVTFLRGLLGEDGRARVRKRMRTSPGTWWMDIHFGAGMATRNRLRDAGFGEKRFDIDNLDNIYVALLEEAAARDGKG